MTIHHLTRDEWWDVARRVRPDLTRQAFDAMWDEFQAVKRARGMQ